MDNLQKILKNTPPGSKLEVEIGCGNGHFLSEYCEKNNDIILLGIEKKKKRCAKAQTKINKKGLNNAVIIQGRAEAFLENVPRAIVDQYHIYFPDPWPKTKHRRRRFLRMVNLDKLFLSLKNNGLIFFATDFFDYYIQVKILFLLRSGLSLIEQSMPEQVFSSIYGKKYMDMGKNIYSIAAKKNSISE